MLVARRERRKYGEAGWASGGHGSGRAGKVVKGKEGVRGQEGVGIKRGEIHRDGPPPYSLDIHNLSSTDPLAMKRKTWRHALKCYQTT